MSHLTIACFAGRPGAGLCPNQVHMHNSTNRCSYGSDGVYIWFEKEMMYFSEKENVFRKDLSSWEAIGQVTFGDSELFANCYLSVHMVPLDEISVEFCST